MISLLATRGADTKLRATPFTQAPIPGVHSVVYRPGVEAIPFAGDTGSEPLGAYGRGVHRLFGVLFSHHGSAAEALLSVSVGIDLVVHYLAAGGHRKRTFLDVLFVGDATVTIPRDNAGVSPLIGVPFRVQIPAGVTLADHVIDEGD